MSKSRGKLKKLDFFGFNPSTTARDKLKPAKQMKFPYK
jgi:hypothetical protein